MLTLSSPDIEADFFKYEHGVKLFSQMQSCITSYKSKESKTDSTLNQKLLIKLNKCLSPFRHVKKRYAMRSSLRLSQIDFLSKPYKCSKEKLKEELKYEEKKPAAALCIDLKERENKRKAAILFQEIKYKLKYTEIRY